jgi:nicotinate-nucleotide pyrophosphorylase (carboxylating)
MEYLQQLNRIIDIAVQEDIGSGDYSSLACLEAAGNGKVHIIAKSDGVIAGLEVAKMVFHRFDSQVSFRTKLSDGNGILSGDVICTAEGDKAKLLSAERTVLNFMQRMSGIATRTRQYVDLIKHTNTIILDTRKTTPGLRFLEKEAVKIGGGQNHRFGLYDMIMLKDNHIDFSGGIPAAIERVQNFLKKNHLNLPIEIEVRNLKDVELVMQTGGIQRIMFDNFSVEDTRVAVKMIQSRYETESSGGINLDTVCVYAETGVDYISVGELTHHIRSLDMSLLVVG